VPTDGARADALDKLPKISARSVVCIQAGECEYGSVRSGGRDLQTREGGGRVGHVDGAFGLWARVLPKYDELTRGLEMADSWATDAHKWLNVGYDSGVVLVRDGMA